MLKTITEGRQANGTQQSTSHPPPLAPSNLKTPNLSKRNTGGHAVLNVLKGVRKVDGKVDREPHHDRQGNALRACVWQEHRRHPKRRLIAGDGGHNTHTDAHAHTLANLDHRDPPGKHGHDGQVGEDDRGNGEDGHRRDRRRARGCQQDAEGKEDRDRQACIASQSGKKGWWSVVKH